MKATYDLLEMVTRTALYLGKSRPWDVFMPVHFDTDRVLHQLWHYLDPDHPWRTDREDKEPVVRDYFCKVDESVARLLALVDDETLVMVMSDHGMGRANNFIVLNNWLLDKGLLQLKRNSDPVERADVPPGVYTAQRTPVARPGRTGSPGDMWPATLWIICSS